MRQLHVAPSPLTGRIFCGHISKDNRTWLADKTDVTGEACAAVAKHVLHATGGKDIAVVITENGQPKYEIKVISVSDKLETPEVELHGQWFPADQVPACTDRRQRQPAGQPAATAAAPSVTGYVSYDVRVTCPHCERGLELTQFPYDDDESEYSPAEDDLGLALFGTTQKPATWAGLAIAYPCCWCRQIFMVSDLEI